MHISVIIIDILFTQDYVIHGEDGNMRNLAALLILIRCCSSHCFVVVFVEHIGERIIANPGLRFRVYGSDAKLSPMNEWGFMNLV